MWSLYFPEVGKIAHCSFEWIHWSSSRWNFLFCALLPSPGWPLLQRDGKARKRNKFWQWASSLFQTPAKACLELVLIFPWFGFSEHLAFWAVEVRLEMMLGTDTDKTFQPEGFSWQSSGGANMLSPSLSKWLAQTPHSRRVIRYWVIMIYCLNRDMFES